MNTDSGKVKLALLLVSSLTIMSMITISASLPDMTNAFSDVLNGKKLVKLVLLDIIVILQINYVKLVQQ